MMGTRVLLADGDPRSLRVLDVALRAEGCLVQTAARGADAWDLLQQAPPDVVVASGDLEGIDGFDLCSRCKQAPALSNVLFILQVADDEPAHKIRGLQVGADDFLGRPAYKKEVVNRVRAMVQRRERRRLAGAHAARDDRPAGQSAPVGAPSFVGDLADIGVTDLLGLVETNGRSGVAHLRGPSGAPAAIYFRGGVVIDAEVGRLVGLDALFRLLSWTTGSFEVEWKNIRRRNAIERPSADLVIEGMQRLDAWNQLRDQLPDQGAVLEVDYGLLAERLAEIPDEVNEILRLCDGVRTIAQVLQDSTVPDVEALTALIRLREEGIVDERDSGSRFPRTATSARLEQWLGPGSASIRPSARPARGQQASGSGPVEQALVDRLARDSMHDDRHEAGTGMAGSLVPPPPPSRRTDPGLGLPAADHEVRPDAAASTPGGTTSEPPVPAFDPASSVPLNNVIPFPAGVDPFSLPPGRTTLRGIHHAAALPATPPIAASAPAHADIAPPAADAYVLELDADTALPDLPAGESSESGPAQAADRAGEIRRPTPPPAPGIDEPLVEVLAALTDEPTSGATREELLGPPAHVQARADISSPSPLPVEADATARLRFEDDDISRRDALDELGLPPRGRGMTILAAGLVLVAAGAFATYRVRTRTAHLASTNSRTTVAPVSAAASAGVHPPPDVELPPAGRIAATAEAASPVEVHSAAPAAGAPAAAEATPAPTPGVATAPAPHELPVPPPSPAVVEKPSAVVGKSAADTDAPTARPTKPAAPGEPEATRASPVRPTGEGARALADCRAAFSRGRMRAASSACRAAAAGNPQSAEALTLFAHAELNRGQLRHANELASKAVALDPDMADAYVILGGVSQDSGQNQKAKAAYRRYLQVAPQGRYAAELRSILNSL